MGYDMTGDPGSQRVKPDMVESAAAVLSADQHVTEDLLAMLNGFPEKNQQIQAKIFQISEEMEPAHNLPRVIPTLFTRVLKFVNLQRKNQ